jgi:hypothetical protein
VPKAGKPTFKKPTIFVSIDIEGGSRNQPPYEVGVSILNTASLKSTSQAQSPIQSHNFCIFSRWGYIKSPNRFIFGVSDKVSWKKVEDFLQRITSGGQHSNPLYKTNNTTRIVLIGHGIKNDMLILEKHVSGLWQSTPITAVIDLGVLQGKMKLGTLLERLKIGEDVSQKWLHSAGNDANYTLRAVLLSTISQDLDIKADDVVYQGRVEKIKQVALGNIPDMVRHGNKRMRIRRKTEIQTPEAEQGIGECLDDLGVGWYDFLIMQEMGQEEKVRDKEDRGNE